MTTRETPDVWNEPIGVASPGPAVWFVGAHGGAGVSTLTHYLPFAGDSRRAWPSGQYREIESPYAVLVARETIEGLRAAHEAIIAHGDTGMQCELLGLITVAASDRPAKPVRQYLDVVRASVPAHWPIAHHRFLAHAAVDQLPSWHPLGVEADHTRATSAQVPSDVIDAGRGIVTAIQRSLPFLRSA